MVPGTHSDRYLPYFKFNKHKRLVALHRLPSNFFFFFSRTLSDWNSVPPSAGNLDSLDSFLCQVADS